MFPELVIGKATELIQTVQTYAAKGHPFAAVISLEHPHAENAERGRAPRLAEQLGGDWQQRQLILTMWDIEQARPDAPNAAHVHAALKHFDTFAPASLNRPVLVHCRQGKARSTALALALLRHRSGNGTEAACLERLLQIAPQAAPNLLLVAAADAVIGCNGNLIEIVRNHPEITARRMMAEASRAAQIASGRFADFEKIAPNASGTTPQTPTIRHARSIETPKN